MTNVIYFVLFMFFIIVIAGVFFTLGFFYGKETEKENWHKKILQFVNFSQGSKWSVLVRVERTKGQPIGFTLQKTGTFLGHRTESSPEQEEQEINLTKAE